MFTLLRLLSRTLVLIFLNVTLYAGSTNYNGAGSSAVYPVLVEVAQAYEKATGTRINYTSTGSAGGLQQLAQQQIDFAAADMPLAAFDKLNMEALQFPLVLTAVVPVYNLPNINNLMLTGEVLADIYLGHITQWNDPAIQALNEHITMPELPIIPIARAGGSGTTYNFTHYLSKITQHRTADNAFVADVSQPWNFISVSNNAAVAQQVSLNVGTIGYMEHAQAVLSQLDYAHIANQSQDYVSAEKHNIQAAVETIDWLNETGLNLIPTDQPGADSWPITMAIFVMLNAKDTPTDIIHFLKWFYQQGDEVVEQLGYIALPASVRAALIKELDNLLATTDT